MKKNSFLYWVVFVLLCIWQLPQFISSCVFLLFCKGTTLYRHEHFNMCFKITNMNLGVCLGPFSVVTDYCKDATVSHEMDGHGVDSKIFGPLYLLIIGLPSALNNVLGITERYYDFWTERLANKHAKVHETDRGYLVFNSTGKSNPYPENYPND